MAPLPHPLTVYAGQDLMTTLLRDAAGPAADVRSIEIVEVGAHHKDEVTVETLNFKSSVSQFEFVRSLARNGTVATASSVRKTTHQLGVPFR